MYKPSVPVIVITTTQQVANQLNGTVKNCKCTVVESLTDSQQLIAHGLKNAKACGLAHEGDMIVAVYGNCTGTSGSTNTLHVYTV